MAKYRITAPDGNSYEVTAPDDATQEQVLAYAQQNYQGAANPDFGNVRSSVTQNQPADTNPTTGMSGFDRFAAGVGKSIVDTGRGLKQAGTSALRNLAGDATGLTGTSKMESLITGEAPGSNPVTRWADRSLSRQQQEIDRSRQLDAPLMDTGAGLAGNITGTLAQILGPGIALRGTSAAASFLPRTIKGNAAQGALIGAVQPTGAGDSRLANLALGGAFGMAGAALPIAGGKLFNLARGAGSGATVSGAQRRAGEILRSEAANPAGLAMPQPSAIPGVQRTLSEETLDPGIARLERQMRGQSNMFDPIDRANNAARAGQLERIAGSDGDMAAAIAARSTATQGARQQAMDAGDVDIRNTVSVLDDAIKSQEGRPAVQAGLRQVRNLLVKESEDAPGLVTTTNESRVPVLDNVRKTIGDMLSGKYGGENAAALQGSRELMAVRDAMNDEIAGQVPAFGAYLDAFRQASKPINRMEVGRVLAGSSSGGAVLDPQTGAQVLMPASFSRQARDLDAVAAKATGFAKAKASDILTSQDIAAIKAIQDDLQRQSFRATAGSGGNSMTFERQALQDKLGRRMAGRLPVVGGFVEALDQMGNQRVNERLAYLIANPAEARRVVSALPQQQRGVVNKALLQLSARPAAALPAVVND